MTEQLQLQLQELGLLATEAHVYLALVRNGVLSANAIARLTGIPRSSVYTTLDSLSDRGLIESGTGYGSRFSSVPPAQALPSLVAGEREAAIRRERLAGELVEQLSSLEEPAEKNLESELIQVLRDPRVCAQRIAKLQREAEREIDALVKSPIITNIGDNPEETATLRRGLRVRAIYEPDVLEDEKIAPYLKTWIDAGEQARVHDGELPLKLVLFDSRVAWMPLATTIGSQKPVTVLVQHHQLAHALQVLFEHLWEESKPLKLGRTASVTSRPKAPGRTKRSVNGA